MASGKKNYFRHSFHARKHSGIAGMIEDHGKEAYFHFFALVELCAEQASDSFPEDAKFTFRRSTVCRELLVTNSRLSRHLLVTVPSLIDDIVVTEKEVQILFPKLAKYMGKYESKSTLNSPNKEIKEKKERKEVEAPAVSPILEVVKAKRTRKKNLPKMESEETLKTSPLAFLFKPDDEIQSWLKSNGSSFNVQKELIDSYSHHILADEVKTAFQWQQERSPRNAGLYLKTWMKRSNKAAYGDSSDKEQEEAAREFFKKKFGHYPEETEAILAAQQEVAG